MIKNSAKYRFHISANTQARQVADFQQHAPQAELHGTRMLKAFQNAQN
jgi:hypothetical protein